MANNTQVSTGLYSKQNYHMLKMHFVHVICFKLYIGCTNQYEVTGQLESLNATAEHHESTVPQTVCQEDLKSK